MNKKIILVSFLTLFLSGVFLFSETVWSDDTPPEKNPLCWLQKDCVDYRANKDAFVLDPEICPGYLKDRENNDSYKWGKCLAGGATITQVSFGGNAKFSNIGYYIKTIYNYALVILAILSSIMIIVAGIQYVGSAGSQEMISSAKKKISGAIIGLALAYMSYTILNMINPNTINLRLPQIYLIREVPVSSENLASCDPKGGEKENGKCQAHYNNPNAYCQALGADGLEGPCAKLVRNSIQLAANVAVLATPIPGGAVVGNLLLSGGKLVAVAKIGGYLYAQDKFLETSPVGVCVIGNQSASAGSFCDPTGKKSKCAEGLACLVVPATTGLSCWTGSDLGICSSGKLNAVCNDDSNCAACRQTSATCLCRPVASNLSACTDGNSGSSCVEDTNCNSPLKCVRVASTIGFCGTGGTQSGGACSNNLDCESQGFYKGCYTFVRSNGSCLEYKIDQTTDLKAMYGFLGLYQGVGIENSYPVEGKQGVCKGDESLTSLFIKNNFKTGFRQPNETGVYYCDGGTYVQHLGD